MLGNAAHTLRLPLVLSHPLWFGAVEPADFRATPGTLGQDQRISLAALHAEGREFRLCLRDSVR